MESVNENNGVPLHNTILDTIAIQKGSYVHCSTALRGLINPDISTIISQTTLQLRS